MVHPEALMADVHGEVRILRSQTDVIHAQIRRQILQLASPVHHANRTHMIALGEQQLNDKFPLSPQSRSVRPDHHALQSLRDARSMQLRLAFNLD
jgi:hypothetical protein